jgi:hypothetical protein
MAVDECQRSHRVRANENSEIACGALGIAEIRNPRQSSEDLGHIGGPLLWRPREHGAE